MVLNLRINVSHYFFNKYISTFLNNFIVYDMFSNQFIMLKGSKCIISNNSAQLIQWVKRMCYENVIYLYILYFFLNN